MLKFSFITTLLALITITAPNFDNEIKFFRGFGYTVGLQNATDEIIDCGDNSTAFFTEISQIIKDIETDIAKVPTDLIDLVDLILGLQYECQGGYEAYRSYFGNAVVAFEADKEKFYAEVLTNIYKNHTEF